MKTVTQIFQQLQPALEELEQNRVKTLRKANRLLLITLGIGIVAGGLVFRLGLENVPTFLWIILGIGAIIPVAFHFSFLKRLKDTYKQKVITKIVQSINPTFQYQPKAHISLKDFKKGQLFRGQIDRYTGEDYVTGKLDKTDFRFSEVHAERQHTDDKGNTNYSTIFEGLFMIADFHKHFKGITVVVPDRSEKILGGWLGKKIQKMGRGRKGLVYMEDPEFEKAFAVFSTDQIEARYILSTSMLRNILALKDRFNCKVYLAFIDSYVSIAIDWNRNILEPNIRQSLLNETTIEKFVGEILSCLEIIEILNLNTRIWTKL